MLDSKESIKKFDAVIYWIIALIIPAGFLVTTYSFAEICTEACAEAHGYKLLGLKFEYFGFLLFSLAGLLHAFSWKYPKLSYLTGLCFAGAVGAELWLIYFQKTVIGKWCSVCLSIAAIIGMGALAFLISYIVNFIILYRKGQKGELMNTIYKGITSISVVLLGLLITALGIGKYDQLKAAEQTVKESLAFGDLKSPIEVFLFTDWQCPACRALEPEIEKMAPEIMKEAKLTFVDHALHPETLNFSPYNVSFLIKEKGQYFRLRGILTELSVKTGTPTDEMIEDALKPLGVKYQQLNFADITLSQKYFKQLSKQFGIHQTPTMVIVNRETKKGKKLVGGAEITESNVLKAIESLKTGK